ncbi:hypothetical protein FBR00_17175 [Anaerolineae bacterium CFX4]|nr:hypothetical protein [Anaerolineae bacterium CFX4]
MSHEHIELRDSPIAGRGVFATRHIKAGEVVFTAHPDDIKYEIDAVYAMPPDQRDAILYYTWQCGRPSPAATSPLARRSRATTARL